MLPLEIAGDAIAVKSAATEMVATGEVAAKVADGNAVLRHRPHGVFGRRGVASEPMTGTFLAPSRPVRVPPLALWAAALAALALLGGCGKKVILKPAEGRALPPKAATS